MFEVGVTLLVGISAKQQCCSFNTESVLQAPDGTPLWQKKNACHLWLKKNACSLDAM